MRQVIIHKADALEYGDPIPPEDVAELESLTVVV